MDIDFMRNQPLEEKVNWFRRTVKSNSRSSDSNMASELDVSVSASNLLDESIHAPHELDPPDFFRKWIVSNADSVNAFFDPSGWLQGVVDELLDPTLWLFQKSQFDPFCLDFNTKTMDQDRE